MVAVSGNGLIGGFLFYRFLAIHCHTWKDEPYEGKKSYGAEKIYRKFTFANFHYSIV